MSSFQQVDMNHLKQILSRSQEKAIWDWRHNDICLTMKPCFNNKMINEVQKLDLIQDKAQNQPDQKKQYTCCTFQMPQYISNISFGWKW